MDGITYMQGLYVFYYISKRAPGVEIDMIHRPISKGAVHNLLMYYQCHNKWKVLQNTNFQKSHKHERTISSLSIPMR